MDVARLILNGLLLACLSACSSLTPHENFRSHMSHNIGKDIDDPLTEGVNPHVFVGSKILPNGNIENEYRLYGSCRYFFEVDARTRKIVSWRFEGSEHDCIINP
jgi:hypothetical protein